MAVKRKVMELGGFGCEYFISHTKEVQEMADALIDLDAFVASDAENEVSGAETALFAR